MNNQEWSEKILQKFDPDFKHRWVIYNELLVELLGDNIVWLDCGAGNNEIVKGFNHLCKTSIGIDLINPMYEINFVKADIKSLPVKSDCADLISLRFVVEHLNNPEIFFKEFNRILKSKGKIIILTTNILSPFIFLPKLLLPYSIKRALITKIFKVKDNDVFPTYHKINSIYSYRRMKQDFKVLYVQFISALISTRKWVFAILFLWHLVTMPKILNKFRTNILVVLEKI